MRNIYFMMVLLVATMTVAFSDTGTTGPNGDIIIISTDGPTIIHK